MAAGVQVFGAASGSDADYRSDSNTNAQVAAGQDLAVKSGQDTTVAGANLEGNKVNMDVGGNLVVASKQDTSDSKSSNWSAENARNSENRQDEQNNSGADNEDSFGESGNPYAETLEGSSSSHDHRQINRATIGEGGIIIRSDPAAGLEGLNRDLAKAQEITKDKNTSVTVYIDSAAIEEVASGFKGIQENAEKVVSKSQLCWIP
eukprot:TRINITY_DN8568_c0_g2_i4.p3 TRINITY_DN8568_c0_g2~~TRINITY_DN8568_c0_g2_i4.p3  ORF type:complete len:205 (+),score=55.00 TRINITY_DN8568_c0_g2_i4:454-1068(+)